MDQIEKLLKQRTQMLQLTVMGFSLWQGSWLASDIFTLSGTPATVLSTITAIGGVMYALSLLRLIQLGLNVRKHEAEGIMADELSREQQYKAFFFAYFVVAGLAAFLLGIEAFIQIDSTVILRGLVLAAVLTPLLVFLWLDKQADKEVA